ARPRASGHSPMSSWRDGRRRRVRPVRVVKGRALFAIRPSVRRGARGLSCQPRPEVGCLMGVSEPVGATPAVDSPAVRARALFPLLRARARQLDDERHLTQEVVDAITDAGLVRTLVPTRWAGPGLTLLEALDATIEIARASGSAGWVQS